MKRLSLVIIGIGCLLSLNTQATSLLQDGFNYTASDNLGYGSTTPPWTATASATANMSIGNGNLSYSGLNNLGGNDLLLNAGAAAGSPAYSSLSSQITSGTLYFSFLIECTALPTSANTYLAGLTPSSHLGPNGNSSDAIDVYVRNLSTGWQLGVRTTGVSASYETTQLDLNTVYFAVYKYTFGATTSDASTAQLFLSPTPGSSEPVSATVTISGTSTLPDISAFGFKAQTSTAIGNYIFDNILVGTTWADVTPIIPEPTTFALAGLGILGFAFSRRMRH